jgi:hypothetical protein
MEKSSVDVKHRLGFIRLKALQWQRWHKELKVALSDGEILEVCAVRDQEGLTQPYTDIYLRHPEFDEVVEGERPLRYECEFFQTDSGKVARRPMKRHGS